MTTWEDAIEVAINSRAQRRAFCHGVSSAVGTGAAGHSRNAALVAISNAIHDATVVAAESATERVVRDATLKGHP